MLNYLHHVKFNAIAIILVEFITCAITLSVDYTGAGMSAIIIKWAPALIGLCTLFLYFLSRVFTNKFNWVISLIGIALMIYSALHIQQMRFTEVV